MKTVLYKHIVNGGVLISTEVHKNNAHLIEVIKDDISEWCNDYADYLEADRFLGQFERDLSVKNIYLSILDKDISCIYKELLLSNDTGNELLERLEKL